MQARPRHALWTLAALCATSAAFAAGTVTLTLESTQDGQTVSAGATIDWTIKVQVSTGDNLGLAAVATDLVHDANNPATFDIPPADIGSIDATMQQFSRPLGIANPGEGGASTGYIGVQRGNSGEMILKQIGGAVNSFGVAGTVMGTDPTVPPGVGQSGAQIVASGSFLAPSTAGTYTFRLDNAVVNVFDAINSPPNFSPVSAATVDMTGGSFSFTVGGPAICLGDLDCDGEVGFGDINPFVDLLVGGYAAWQALYPGCPGENGDLNENGDYGQDGSADFGDINPFVDLLTGGGVPIPCN